MVEKGQIIEIKFLAKITIRMRENFAMGAVPHISELDVLSKRLDGVEPLLPRENSSSFQANLAESFFVHSFHVSLQRRHVWKLLLRMGAVGNHAI